MVVEQDIPQLFHVQEVEIEVKITLESNMYVPELAVFYASLVYICVIMQPY